MEDKNVIAVQHLYKSFGEIKAVDNLSFTVKQGDIYGLLGVNGSGKSTTLRILSSLVYPDAGNINILGQSIFNKDQLVRKKIGVLIERPDFYTYLTARKNLEILMKCSGVGLDRKKIDESLVSVGLWEYRDKKVRVFSQGMKQRLGIAQALIHDPELLILDEPANGLDPHGMVDIRNLIQKLNREQGKTVVLSSHILKEVEMIANRMLIINEGRVVAEGTVGKILDQYEYKIRFTVKEVNKAMQILNASEYSPVVYKENDGILCRINEGEVTSVADLLIKNGIQINGIIPLKSLEELFMGLTTEKNI